MSRTAGCGHPALRKQHRWCPAAGRCGHRPLRKGEQAASTSQASGAQRSVCGADGRNGWKLRQGSSTKGPSTADNPSVSLRLTAPFTQGSLRDGGCGLPRRPCGPPRNDNRSLSFRGAERRGNPSFLRWTGVRAAPRKTRGTARRVVGPYGKPNQPPKPADAQRSVRASGREGWAGIGARTIPKRGPPPRPPRQRLAKRKARKEQLVKFSLCPIPSECSTAY